MKRLFFFRTWSLRRQLACGFIGGGLVLIIASIGTVTTAIHLENQDEFCAECHTEPEMTYVDRAQADDPSDLASYHAQLAEAVRCIDCHSGYGTGGRILALYQGAQDLVAFVSGDYHQPATTTRPLGDAPCAKCHTQPSRDYPSTLEETPTLITSNAHYHWVEYTDAWLMAEPNPHGTCIACHQSHSAGTKAVLGYRHMPSVNVTCDGCHLALAGTIPD